VWGPECATQPKQTPPVAFSFGRNVPSWQWAMSENSSPSPSTWHTRARWVRFATMAAPAAPVVAVSWLSGLHVDQLEITCKALAPSLQKIERSLYE
jgi:hypothetical protein